MYGFTNIVVFFLVFFSNLVVFPVWFIFENCWILSIPLALSHYSNFMEQICLLICTKPGPLFTKKTPSYGYRDPYYKPKTVWRPSQVYNGNSYTDKTASSQWIEAQVGTELWLGKNSHQTLPLALSYSQVSCAANDHLFRSSCLKGNFTGFYLFLCKGWLILNSNVEIYPNLDVKRY